MINQYPAWKYVLVVCVMAIGIFYAFPNLYGKKPTVVMKSKLEEPMTEVFQISIETLLKKKNIPYQYAEIVGEKRLFIYFDANDVGSQLSASSAIKEIHSTRYTIAQNLVPDTPDWMSSFNAKPMQLGLDLQGGVHAVYETDLNDAMKNFVNQFHKRFGKELKEKRIRKSGLFKIISAAKASSNTSSDDSQNDKHKNSEDDFSDRYVALNTSEKYQLNENKYGIRIKFSKRNKKNFPKAKEYLQLKYSEDYYLYEIADPDAEDMYLTMLLKPAVIDKEKASVVEKNIAVLRRRADESGVSEPVIRQYGKARIVIELPGVQNPEMIKEIFGKQAILEAHGVSDNSPKGDIPESEITLTPEPNEVVYFKEKVLPVDPDDKSKGVKVVRYPKLLKKPVVWSGVSVKDAKAGFSSGKSASHAVHIKLDDTGGEQNSKYTTAHVKKNIAIIFINKERVKVKDKDGKFTGKYKITKKVTVINNATIQEPLYKSFEINNMGSSSNARQLAILLRSGALAAPIYNVEERIVGPSVGKENVERGMFAIIIGFSLVLLFMLVYYRMFGFIANVALIFNMMLLIGLLSILQATLTLPGIAGIVLTVGMAVDANVLIFERIREELRLGNSTQASIHAGYEKALVTIADANITTLIAAVVLLGIGSGPVRGFAVTLSLGILTSMFTAIMGTRALVNMMYGGRKVKELSL